MYWYQIVFNTSYNLIKLDDLLKILFKDKKILFMHNIFFSRVWQI